MVRFSRSSMRIACAAGIAIAAFLSAGPVLGQSTLQGSAGFLVAVPSGEFRNHLDANGYGFGGRFGWRPSRSPVLIGLEGGFLIYGHESRREPFSTTIPDVTVEVTTDNNLVQVGSFLRLQPASGLFRPYLDAGLGLNYLFTETTIKNEDGDENVASSKNFEDTVLNYGGGGGVMLAVYRRRDYENPGPRKVESVLLDLSARYVAGGEARYLKKGSIRREDGRVLFDVVQSRTDLITIQVGAALEF